MVPGWGGSTSAESKLLRPTQARETAGKASRFPRLRVGLKSSRQRHAEVRAKGGQVQAVDGAVAVLVEVPEVVRVCGCGAESCAEGGQVQAVDRRVAVDVAEQAEEGVLPVGGHRGAGEVVDL